MDGSNINLGNNFNQKDAEKKNISLRYFLHDYPALPRHTFTRRHQIFTGQADSNIRGQADSETYGNVHRCFYTGMDRWIEINEAIIDCCHS